MSKFQAIALVCDLAFAFSVYLMRTWQLLRSNPAVAGRHRFDTLRPLVIPSPMP